jgi:putative endonuclease
MVIFDSLHAGAQVTNRKLGIAGEDAACSFLRRKGYRILDRNYRCPLGELDIIARKGGQLVFCEVKARSGGEAEEALGAVDAKRQGRMARAASHYLDETGRVEKVCRFDVIALLKNGLAWKIVHVEDAFEIGEL